MSRDGPTDVIRGGARETMSGASDCDETRDRDRGRATSLATRRASYLSTSHGTRHVSSRVARHVSSRATFHAIYRESRRGSLRVCCGCGTDCVCWKSISYFYEALFRTPPAPLFRQLRLMIGLLRLNFKFRKSTTQQGYFSNVYPKWDTQTECRRRNRTCFNVDNDCFFRFWDMQEVHKCYYYSSYFFSRSLSLPRSRSPRSSLFRSRSRSRADSRCRRARLSSSRPPT